MTTWSKPSSTDARKHILRVHVFDSISIVSKLSTCQLSKSRERVPKRLPRVRIELGYIYILVPKEVRGRRCPTAIMGRSTTPRTRSSGSPFDGPKLRPNRCAAACCRVERFGRRGTEPFEPFEPFEFFQNRIFSRKFQHFLTYRRNSDKISSKSEHKSVKRIQK